MDKINFGIMGCGGIASRFCGVLNTESGVKIRAVSARSLERAEAFAAKFNAERACTYEELAQDPGVDVVYIATIHPAHYGQIKMCLNSGKHVLCEKPMVLSAAQARECFALAREKNLLLLEGMWTRCLPAVQKATEWALGGAIGEVKLITADFCFNNPCAPDKQPGNRLHDPSMGGGALYDVGVYVIEFATGILKEKPTDVAAVCQFNEMGADASTSISLKFAGGAVAALNCAINVTTPWGAVIYGTKGSVALNQFWKAEAATRYDENGNAAEVFRAEFDDGFRYEIRHVAGLLQRGQIESEWIPQADTIACAEVFETILAGKVGVRDASGRLGQRGIV